MPAYEFAAAVSSFLTSLPNSLRSSERATVPPFVPAPLALHPIAMQGRTGNGTSEGDMGEVEELMGDIQGGYTPYLGRLTAVACLGGLQFGWVGLHHTGEV